MRPSEIWVVYDAKYRRIVTVHSAKHFAMIARQDAIKDTLRANTKTMSDLERKGLIMRFCVETLQQTIDWIAEEAIDQHLTGI